MDNKSKLKDKRVPAAVRRRIILDAAISTFAEYGYHGAKMETIAERADVTKPILYRHFPSKLSLIVALVDQAGENLIEALSQPFEEWMDWRAAIVKDVKGYLDFAENYRQGFNLLYSVGMTLDQEVSQHVNDIRSRLILLISEHIRLFTDVTKISASDIEMYAAILVGMVEEATIYWSKHEEISRETCENILVRAVQSVMSNLPPRPLRQ